MSNLAMTVTKPVRFMFLVADFMNICLEFTCTIPSSENNPYLSHMTQTYNGLKKISFHHQPETTDTIPSFI